MLSFLKKEITTTWGQQLALIIIGGVILHLVTIAGRKGFLTISQFFTFLKGRALAKKNETTEKYGNLRTALFFTFSFFRKRFYKKHESNFDELTIHIRHQIEKDIEIGIVRDRELIENYQEYKTIKRRELRESFHNSMQSILSLIEKAPDFKKEIAKWGTELRKPVHLGNKYSPPDDEL